MQITVRLNGILAKEIGVARTTVRLQEGATIEDLRDHLMARYPHLSEEIARAVVIGSGMHQPASAVVSDEEEIAFLMPVAGG